MSSYERIPENNIASFQPFTHRLRLEVQDLLKQRENRDYQVVKDGAKDPLDRIVLSLQIHKVRAVQRLQRPQPPSENKGWY